MSPSRRQVGLSFEQSLIGGCLHFQVEPLSSLEETGPNAAYCCCLAHTLPLAQGVIFLSWECSNSNHWTWDFISSPDLGALTWGRDLLREMGVLAAHAHSHQKEAQQQS